MNKVWLIIFITSISLLIFKDPNEVLLAFSSGANSAILLSFELCAIYAVWSGILKILERTGITLLLTKAINPLISFLFGKNLSFDTKRYLSINMSANILGMGGAATPAGIKAIESMDDKTENATSSMKMLVVISATGLQLIPTTIIAILSANGGHNPSSVILPSLIASTISTIIGIFLCKILERFKNKREKSK